MQYLNTQLQNLGFATTLIPGTLSVAENVVFGGDPVNATWDIYPASNSQIWGYYDSNALNFYSAGYYNDLPASDSVRDELGRAAGTTPLRKHTRPLSTTTLTTTRYRC